MGITARDFLTGDGWTLDAGDTRGDSSGENNSGGSFGGGSTIMIGRGQGLDTKTLLIGGAVLLGLLYFKGR